MTKSELIARLAERFPQLVAKDADFAVKMILDAMSEALVRGDRIEIRGFGSFNNFDHFALETDNLTALTINYAKH